MIAIETYTQIKALSEALDDLYKEFNALKERLGDLTTKFDGVEAFVDEMNAGRHLASQKLPPPDIEPAAPPPPPPNARSYNGRARSPRRTSAPRRKQERASFT
ncbi:hypothetical protein FKM82_028504 [Ascaphus truei]